MATFNRLMNIDEANPAGNVHGGQLLRFMSDDAGYVAALRHLNKDAKGKFNAALGTVSKTAFHAPVHVGDLVTARAEVLSASAHSLVVHVDLWAESLMTGHRRLTNSTDAIYVALDANEASGLKVSSDRIPHVEHVDHEKEQHGQEVYREHLLARQDEKQSAAELKRRFKEEQWTASLGHVLLPTDCAPTNRTAKGGRIIKLMDEVGAVAAWRHSRTNCVTASIETLRFRKPLHLGDLVSLRARPTYASSKSLEVEIIVETASPITGESHIAAHAFFVFVALDENGTAIKLPPLDSYSEEAEARYNERKANQIKNRK
ncbi:Cytosolic acyl coenzyme A thioester hydrolase [Hondaea fermentalgiana]|uniref:Cytosolic acyl coenzyme A thioester hydrolase n=1 Tax=Hondaea fermentalgiana TaxID=2315210 RepID=A0A2R5GHD9_9STRA|nr:Cytosolic acyl coenzyme A thioester hydrolase [Hondaea fermentalgiana]|eukprot:GBG28043.1 Cytosolic acyl coenzyme A thioester hydrolase [Hondaea fermentalgiana]